MGTITTYLAYIAYLPFSSFIAMLLSMKWQETDSETLQSHSPAHLYLDLISINARRLMFKQEWGPWFLNCNRFQVFIPQLLAWASLASLILPQVSLIICSACSNPGIWSRKGLFSAPAKQQVTSPPSVTRGGSGTRETDAKTAPRNGGKGKGARRLAKFPRFSGS